MDDAATSRAPIDGEPRAHVRGVALALAGALAFAGALAPAAADQNTGQNSVQHAVRDAAVARWLGLLGARAPDDRRRAERGLVALLEPRDAALLVAAAQRDDAEVKARLASVLASAPRHLGLAVALNRAGGSAADVGRRALLGQLAAWKPGLEMPPVARRELTARLAEIAFEQRTELLSLPAELDPREAFGLLARRGSLPAALVVDPELARAAPFEPSTGPAIVATWEEHLQRIAGVRGVALDGARARGENPRDPDPILWLRLARPPSAGGASGAEQLVAWLGALDDPSPGHARAAAIALAASGWPAALDLLAQRWTLLRDGAALDGLLAAAARGRAHGVLARPAAIAQLLAEMDTAFAGGAAPAALERARALAGIIPIGPDGTDLAAGVAEGFDGASGAGRLARMGILRHMAAGGPRVRALGADVLSAPEGVHAPRLLFEAVLLRALWAEPGQGGPAVPGAPAALLRAPVDRHEERALARALGAAQLAPPEAWRDPAALPAALAPGARLVVLDQWLCAGETAVAARHGAAFLGSSAGGETARRDGRLSELADFLEEWRAGGEGARLGAFAAGVGAILGGGEGAEALALALGLLPKERHSPVLDALARDAGGVHRIDPARLADLAAGPVGTQARAALLDQMRSAAPDADAARAQALRDALVRAERRLQARGMDNDVVQLRFAATAIGREHRTGELGRQILGLSRGAALPRPVRHLDREEWALSGVSPR